VAVTDCTPNELPHVPNCFTSRQPEDADA